MLILWTRIRTHWAIKITNSEFADTSHINNNDDCKKKFWKILRNEIKIQKVRFRGFNENLRMDQFSSLLFFSKFLWVVVSCPSQLYTISVWESYMVLYRRDCNKNLKKHKTSLQIRKNTTLPILNNLLSYNFFVKAKIGTCPF